MLRIAFEMVVAFGFFLFDMGGKAAAGGEEPDHGLVKNMFGRMHRRENVFEHKGIQWLKQEKFLKSRANG